MKLNIENRPLTWEEKQRMDANEIKVVICYEKTTRQKFMRFDVKILNRLIRIATPEQINSQIIRFGRDKRYVDKFTFFGYIEPPVRNMFKNRRGGKIDGGK